MCCAQKMQPEHIGSPYDLDLAVGEVNIRVVAAMMLMKPKLFNPQANPKQFVSNVRF